MVLKTLFSSTLRYSSSGRLLWRNQSAWSIEGLWCCCSYGAWVKLNYFAGRLKRRSWQLSSRGCSWAGGSRPTGVEEAGLEITSNSPVRFRVTHISFFFRVFLLKVIRIYWYAVHGKSYIQTQQTPELMSSASRFRTKKEFGIWLGILSS